MEHTIRYRRIFLPNRYPVRLQFQAGVHIQAWICPFAWLAEGLKKLIFEARTVAQLSKCLPHKNYDLSWVISPIRKVRCTGVCLFSKCWESRARGILGLTGPSSLAQPVGTRFTERFCLKHNKVHGDWGTHLTQTSGLPMYIHILGPPPHRKKVDISLFQKLSEFFEDLLKNFWLSFLE